MKLSRALIFFVFLFSGACSGQITPTFYIPATEEPAADIAETNPAFEVLDITATSPPLPSPSPECTSSLLFLEDLSIPDGTSVSPGDQLDKRWLVQNNGTCNWERGFGLQLIAGPAMGASREKALFPARSGTQAEIQILFTAPQEQGTHRSAWQAHDPQGRLFGDPIFIEVIVENP